MVASQSIAASTQGAFAARGAATAGAAEYATRVNALDGLLGKVRGALSLKFSIPPDAQGSAMVRGIRSGAFIFSLWVTHQRSAGKAGTGIHRRSFHDWCAHSTS